MNGRENPLVSVIVPYFNAEKTLPLALASILAQHYQNWECLVIDDGSIRSPAPIIQKFSDSRIRLIIEGQNHGRGFTRQKGLELARGKYLCMVDADDWIYPNKINTQVDFLEDHPDVAMVTSSMAIVGSENKLEGVRHFGEKIFDPLRAPDLLAIPHAPSMICTEIAREAGYDIHLRIVEDFDFLLKIILRHKYATQNQVLYAYTEFASLDFKKVMASQVATSEILMKYRTQYPKEVNRLLRKISVKAMGHSLLFATGTYGHLIKWRTQKANAQERDDFAQAVKVVGG